MNNQFEQLLEAEVANSFRLTDDMANSLAGESSDNMTPLLVTIAIITSAVSC